jgi:hypothetical protein
LALCQWTRFFSQVLVFRRSRRMARFVFRSPVSYLTSVNVEDTVPLNLAFAISLWRCSTRSLASRAFSIALARASRALAVAISLRSWVSLDLICLRFVWRVRILDDASASSCLAESRCCWTVWSPSRILVITPAL